MRTSNPPSYDKIFEMYVSTGSYGGAAGVMSAYTVGIHRGLLLVNTSTTATNTAFTITNLDNTTTTLAIAPGATLLPVQILKLTVTSAQSTIRIYGLL